MDRYVEAQRLGGLEVDDKLNSRRLIAFPEAQDKASCQLRLAHFTKPGVRSADVRFGSKADMTFRCA